MNYHQSYVFLQDLSNSFHHWFNLSNFHPGVSQQFMVVFLIVILNIWRPKKNFSWILVRSLEDSWFLLVAILSNCFQSRNSFLTHPEYFRVVLISWSSKGHHFRRFLRSKFSASFSNYSKLMSLCSSPYSPGASFKYPLVSSWSIRSHVSKFPRVFSRVI